MNKFITGIVLMLYVSFGLVKAQDLYTEINTSNFRENPIFNQIIDTLEFQPAILNAAVFHLTNEIRLNKKLPAIGFNDKLAEAATMHSKDMAVLGFFSHTNTQNIKHKEPKDRARIIGIKNPHIAENIIEGFILKYSSGDPVIVKSPGIFLNPDTREHLPFHTYLTLAEVMIDSWMHSRGHKKNILSENAIQLGCGTYLYYMSDFNNMPTVKVTQCFQWFEPVQTE